MDSGAALCGAAALTAVMVIGGGIAGSAAAIALARAGREVLLIERETGPRHKVCGEFLSEEALRSLRTLGIDPAALGGVALQGVRLAGGAPAAAAAELPFRAMSLTRRTLDEAMLQTAATAGVQVLRGASVRSLQHEGDGLWTALLDNGERVHAPEAFLATGKHDLAKRPRSSGLQSRLVGFKMYFQLSGEQHAALGPYVELLSYPGGYGGLQPVEDNQANLCCLIDRSALQPSGGGWEWLLKHMQNSCPHLEQRLRGAEPVLARPLAIAPIPYGLIRTQTEAGLWHLGDQAAVIPSFTGDGMSLALHSAALAAAMYLRGAIAPEFQRRLHEELQWQVRMATVFSRGLVWSPTRGLMMVAARTWPRLLGEVARWTRLSQTAQTALAVIPEHLVSAKAPSSS